MKPKEKTTAINDGPFKREEQRETTATAVTTQKKLYIENIETTELKIDGKKATEKIIKLHNNSNHIKQSNLILLHGTTIAGFNIINVPKLHKKTQKPIITVLREKPNEQKIKKAIKNTKNHKQKLKTIKQNPKYKKHPEKNIYYTNTGRAQKEAETTLERLIHKGNYPEPLRIARIITRAITEAKKRG